MEIVYFGDRNTNNRALIISNDEWTRLGKILTKKSDKLEALENGRRVRETRYQMSKKMANGWDNTELNKTKTILEQKRKAFLELEAEQQRRDEEMKRETLEARNRIIEKAYKLKFEERDATKTFNRAIQISEVFKERAIQLKFNEDARIKKMEEDLAMVCEQNAKTEQCKKCQINEKQKNSELKRAEAKMLLEELKNRENKKRLDKIAQYESGKEEMRKISEEIEQMRQTAINRARAAREKLQKDIETNWTLIARNEEQRQADNLEEDLVTTIMAETKKTLARARRSKELELIKTKQKALEEMRLKVITWPIKDSGWAEVDVLNAIEKEEKRYEDGQRERKRLADSRMEHVKICNKLWEEEMAKQQKILNQDHALEIERRDREQKLLAEFRELRRKTQFENAHKLRKELDKQCKDKAAMLLTDRQDGLNNHQVFEQQWHKEDKEFIAYALKTIENKKLAGNTIVPLYKVVEDYFKKNNLCMNQENEVLKNIPIKQTNMSRIIHY